MNGKLEKSAYFADCGHLLSIDFSAVEKMIRAVFLRAGSRKCNLTKNGVIYAFKLQPR